MKKILFIINSLYNGGAERSLVNLLNELSPDQYDIHLLLFRREGLYLAQVPSYVHIIDPPNRVRQLYAPLKQCGALLPFKLLGDLGARFHERETRSRRAYRWDHCYTHLIPPLEGHYDTAIAYISGEVLFYLDDKVSADRKLVFIHNDYRTAHHPKKYDLLHFERMDAMISISERCVQILKEEFPQFKDKIFYLPNITSSTVVRQRALEFQPKEYNCENTLLSIGRLSSQKGFDMAVSAAALLKKQHVPFQWFVIGSGEKKQELEQQIAREDVGDCFRLIGTRENPYPYMKHCAVLVQTSRYEGKSMVLDEAKILGTPIVSTCYPTVADQLLDGQEGIIVGMEPEAIADGIRRLLEQPAERERLSSYLLTHEYGNQAAVADYQKLIDAK